MLLPNESLAALNDARMSAVFWLYHLATAQRNWWSDASGEVPVMGALLKNDESPMRWLIGWCMNEAFGSAGYRPLNETWFVPGDHWKVATRMMSHWNAARMTAACALPIFSCVTSSE